MGLIGSLDDLGLGDILQIINLSQKSGVLTVVGSQGEGRVVFRDGLVRGAVQKGGPRTLRDLLVEGGHVAADAFDSAFDAASRCEEAGDVESVLIERELIDEDELTSLRRVSVENAVITMFSWRSGEFSFDVRSAVEAGDPDLLLAAGVSAQYLAMEGARVQDELMRDGSGTPEFDVVRDTTDARAEVVDVLAQRAVSAVEGEDLIGAELEKEAEAPTPFQSDRRDHETGVDEVPLISVEAIPMPGVTRREEVISTAEAPAEVESSENSKNSESGRTLDPVFRDAEALALSASEDAEVTTHRPAVVVIDPELVVLEWTKRVLKSDFPRVHIFQQSNLGLVRIRQYLARAEIPLLLVSPEVSGEPAAGIKDGADFVKRLKQQAPFMRVLWLCGSVSAPSGQPADGSLGRPRLELLRDPRAAHERDLSAETLRTGVLEALAGDEPVPSGGGVVDKAATPQGLEQLREAILDLGEASARGEVLPRVIEFAREAFSRVAMFMVREGQAEGMAQSGLSLGGGPDQAAFSEISLAISDCAWFESVRESRVAVRGTPSEADRGLCDLLCGPGGSRPLEVYVGPIESSGKIVALLYADHLPGQREIGDTSALEVVLSHAGLALDRAVLERALHDAEGEEAD